MNGPPEKLKRPARGALEMVTAKASKHGDDPTPEAIGRKAGRCVRCRKDVTNLAGAWGYIPDHSPGQMILLSLCGACLMAVTNSDRAVRAFSVEVESLFPPAVTLISPVAFE